MDKILKIRLREVGKVRKGLKAWSRGPDLNRGPVDYESTALPTELPRLGVSQCSIAWKIVSNEGAGM